MRRSALFLGFVTAVSARCSVVPCAGKCAQAVSQVPEVGSAFCSSYLSLEPATTTVTEISGAESTHTNLETISTTITVTASTTTTTLASTGTTVFLKRQVASASAEVISASCSFIPASISSACSCLFGSTTSTSTATVTETSTSTTLYEETATITDVSTTSVVATVSATPTLIVPANPVVNGDFEKYVRTTPYSFTTWSNTTATTGGRLEVVNSVNPCTAGAAYCAGGSVVARAYPPATGEKYVAIAETFVARPSTTYTLVFMYRCLNFDSTSGIDLYYQGSRIGSSRLCATGAQFYRDTSGISFTTDSTGVGELQVRFINPSGLTGLYYYFDQIIATAVEASSP
jgi:hypothetical protein